MRESEANEPKSYLVTHTSQSGSHGGHGGDTGSCHIPPGTARVPLDYFLQEGVPINLKGYLLQIYIVCKFISRRFAFATQPLAQYKIPLYSRIMARLVLLPHSGQM